MNFAAIPKLSPAFVTAGRRHAPDVVLMLFLYVSVSLLAGRVWRFPFDDELITLKPIEQSRSAFDLIVYYLKGYDIHPPLSFLFFYGWNRLGLSEAGLRLCSMSMTALSLALFHVAALTSAVQRNPGPLQPATRILLIVLFGLAPLAIGQGDAIRWYPPFAALIAIFLILYLFAGNAAASWSSAIPLGLAVSMNFIAGIVILAFAIFRYVLQRSFSARFDLTYWLLILILASPGIVAGYSLAMRRFGSAVGTEFGHGAAQAVMVSLLGFFGGDALGISQAWIVIPTIIITVLAILSAIDRQQRDNPVHLLLLLLAGAALMVLAGFAKPRSFLYLVPPVTLLTSLYFDGLLRGRKATFVLAFGVLWLAGSVAAVANLQGGTHPFKRNAAVPYQSILDFIDTNTHGSTLIVSTDPIVPWVLAHRTDGAIRCGGYFLDARRCLASPNRFDSVIVIKGHSNKSANSKVMSAFRILSEEATQGRQKIATLRAGQDDDASLKSWLTGVPLDRHILSVEIYR